MRSTCPQTIGLADRVLRNLFPCFHALKKVMASITIAIANAISVHRSGLFVSMCPPLPKATALPWACSDTRTSTNATPHQSPRWLGPLGRSTFEDSWRTFGCHACGVRSFLSVGSLPLSLSEPHEEQSLHDARAASVPEVSSTLRNWQASCRGSRETAGPNSRCRHIGKDRSRMVPSTFCARHRFPNHSIGKSLEGQVTRPARTCPRTLLEIQT